MVRAGSVKHLESKKKLNQIISIIFIVFLIVLSSIYFFFFKGSDESKAENLTKSQVSKINKKEFVVSQPKYIPKDYKRYEVQIINKNSSQSGCEEIMQRYSKTSNTDKNYIDIYSYSSQCSYPRPADADGFTVADYSGWVSDDFKSLSILIEITVKESMMRIETDLSTKQIKKYLTDFTKLSANSPTEK
jgi:hypothetical protein